MNLLILGGPNLNLLGSREPDIYGSQSYRELEDYIKAVCESMDISCRVLQSNHEGDLVDWIQSATGAFDGIVINAAAYSHTSIAVLDALRAVDIPAVEVHLSDISAREEFRHMSYTALACLASFAGHGFESYREAIEFIKRYIDENA